MAVLGFVQLRDPDHRIPFALFRADRLLTGADFDLESVRVAQRRPLVRRRVRAVHPARRHRRQGAGALRNDPDPRHRAVHEFDLRTRAYTARTWHYRADAAFPAALIGDFTALDEHRFVLIERDDAQGAEARQKSVYMIDLRNADAGGVLEKRLVLDLLDILDPAGVSMPARAGEFGVGNPFSFPLQSVESLEVLDGERLLIANDNNYPFSDGRWTQRDRPDDAELIVVRVPALR